MTNSEFIKTLEAFIESKLPEWRSRNGAYALAVMTEEAKAAAETLRREAAELMAQIAGSDDPNAWALAVKGTRFDSYQAAVQRGEFTDAPDSTAALLHYMLYPGQHNTIRLHRDSTGGDFYSDTFETGGDVREAEYEDAKKYNEGVWSNSADAKFQTFEEYAETHGWA